jgi:hypothetical protein
MLLAWWTMEGTPKVTYLICKLVHLSNVSRITVLAGSRSNVMIVKHTALREFAA